MFSCMKCGQTSASVFFAGAAGDFRPRCNDCGGVCIVVGEDVLANSPAAALPFRAPKGHPLFHELTRLEVEQYERKNADYADNARPMGNFERVSSILGLYPALNPGDPVVVCMVYMLKQLDCALHLLAEKKEGGVENFDTRMGDVHTYAKIARIIYAEQRGGKDE